MSHTRSNTKKVSFLDKKQQNNINKNTNVNTIIRSDIKKPSILKDKGKKRNELKNEKVMEVIQNNETEIKEKEIDQKAENGFNKLNDINIEVPLYSNNNSNNKIKELSTDEYFKITVQNELEKGLLNIAMLHPANPIKFLGNYLIEKSKNYSPNL